MADNSTPSFASTPRSRVNLNVTANPGAPSRDDRAEPHPSTLSIAIIRQFARAYRVERKMPSVFSGYVLN